MSKLQRWKQNEEKVEDGWSPRQKRQETATWDRPLWLSEMQEGLPRRLRKEKDLGLLQNATRANFDFNLLSSLFSPAKPWDRRGGSWIAGRRDGGRVHQGGENRSLWYCSRADIFVPPHEVPLLWRLLRSMCHLRKGFEPRWMPMQEGKGASRSFKTWKFSYWRRIIGNNGCAQTKKIKIKKGYAAIPSSSEIAQYISLPTMSGTHLTPSRLSSVRNL